MKRASLVLATIASVLLSGAGCSTSAVDGAPAPSSTTTDGSFGTSYDPCTTLTDAQITSFGLDPATKTTNMGVPPEFGRGCAWARADFAMSFGVGRQNLNYFKNSTFGDKHLLTIAGRDAVSFRLDAKGGCTVAIATGSTALTIDLVQSVTDRQAGKDPCPPVLAIAQQIAPTLPK